MRFMAVCIQRTDGFRSKYVKSCYYADPDIHSRNAGDAL